MARERFLESQKQLETSYLAKRKIKKDKKSS
jgi:hypothetical protein